MKYIIAIDIGGTTFNTGIFSDSLNQISISSKDKIRHYDGRENVVSAIILQINTLINQNNIDKKDILGIGIATPGPIDAKKGIILNTPNLQIFQNYAIAEDFKKKMELDTYIGNDANLFSLGEWFEEYKNYNLTMGITLGTGIGFGLVVNGELFTGANGMAMEYALSPFEWGICEKNVCIGYIRKRAKELYGEEISPVIIEKYYKRNDHNAIKIYDDFGHNLGVVLSHVINMIDPQVITIGGGLSNAFDCFKKKMFSTLNIHVPSFSSHNIIIVPSKLKEKATMIGASLMIKKNKQHK